MRKILATFLGMLVVTLGLTSIAHAQHWIQVQGKIQAVDCQTNAVVLNAPDGTHVFPMVPDAPVFINSAPTSFCTLRQYVGSNATVSLAAAGSQLVAERVDVFTAAAPTPPPPAPGYGYSGPYYGGPYCYNPYYYSPYYWGPYYGVPYCYGPYSGYYPYYNGPFIGIGIGFVVGPGFHHHRSVLVGAPSFHEFHGRGGRFVSAPSFHELHGTHGSFIGAPRFIHRGGARR